MILEQDAVSFSDSVGMVLFLCSCLLLLAGWTLDCLWGSSWGRNLGSRAIVLSMYYNECSWGQQVPSMEHEYGIWWRELVWMANALQISLVMNRWELTTIWDQFNLKSVDRKAQDAKVIRKNLCHCHRRAAYNCRSQKRVWRSFEFIGQCQAQNGRLSLSMDCCNCANHCIECFWDDSVYPFARLTCQLFWFIVDRASHLRWWWFPWTP